eukprot:11019830-Alexandrium_andersonii.AAC.1
MLGKEGRLPAGCQVSLMPAGRCALRAWPPAQAANAAERCARRARPPVQATNASSRRWPHSRLPSRRGRVG